MFTHGCAYVCTRLSALLRDQTEPVSLRLSAGSDGVFVATSRLADVYVQHVVSSTIRMLSAELQQCVLLHTVATVVAPARRRVV